MPESRKRPDHPFKKPSDIPAKQRTKGTTITTILFSVFGLIIAYFAASGNYIALAAGAVIGGIIGYFIGKSMQEDAKSS